MTVKLEMNTWAVLLVGKLKLLTPNPKKKGTISLDKIIALLSCSWRRVKTCSGLFVSLIIIFIVTAQAYLVDIVRFDPLRIVVSLTALKRV